MTKDSPPGSTKPDAAGGVESVEPLLSEERFHVLVDTVTDYAIFMLDPGGHVISWNAGAERIKGYSPGEIIGKHFTIFYPPEALARALPRLELEVALRDGRFEDEGWRLRKDGSRFWANVVITRLRDSSGRHIGFAKITRDLSERRRQEEALRQSEERLRLLVETVTDYAIFILDAGGYIQTWNAGAERIKGYSRGEILGKHFTVFYPPEALAGGLPERELQTALRDGRSEDEGWRLRKDGTRFWANVVITALFDRTGALQGFAKITRDLTERRRIETLENEGRQTTEFLAMLGHELRNPLAPIRNAVEILRGRGIDDPDLRWAHDLLDRQVSHLGRLVDDLLDVGRIASGKITLQSQPLDLVELVSQAAQTTRAMLEERDQTLSLALPEAPLLAEGDATRLSQVVLNLINNAAKFTQKGGQVWISLGREDRQAVLTVRDNGIGMPPGFVTRAFDLFAQGERALDRSEGGLGLGLAVVRRLVAAHGGSVAAFSAGPGQGSQFVVRLPLLAEAATAAMVPREPEVQDPVHKGRRVLVVDDNMDSAETMAVLFKIWGHDVQVAHDGLAAIAIAVDHRPEIVFLDIGLPGMTGYEVARRLRETPGTASALLVALTGYGQDEDRQRSREAGFARHLVKPIEPEVLQKILAELDRP